MEEKLMQIRWILCEMKTTVMNSRVGPNSPASQVSLGPHCVAHLQRLQSAQDIDVPSCTSDLLNVQRPLHQQTHITPLDNVTAQSLDQQSSSN